MGESKAPDVHHNIICAFSDNPILEFYKDYFDSVYIILHPFKAEAKGNNTTSGLKPTSVSWSQFMQYSGFTSFSQVDIALRNYIGGLVKKYANDADLSTLKRVLKDHKLTIPVEGDLSEFIKGDILSALSENGHEWIYIGDEFGWERKIEDINNIISGQSEIWYPHLCWYTLKNEFLFTSHWDSHFTLLCSDKKSIETLLTKHPFEGFFCDQNTDIYWSVKNNNAQPPFHL